MDDEIDEVVREYGWFAAAISDHKPPFLYTIGLMQTCRHPEFVIFGLEVVRASPRFVAIDRFSSSHGSRRVRQSHGIFGPDQGLKGRV